MGPEEQAVHRLVCGSGEFADPQDLLHAGRVRRRFPSVRAMDQSILQFRWAFAAVTVVHTYRDQIHHRCPGLAARPLHQPSMERCPSGGRKMQWWLALRTLASKCKMTASMFQLSNRSSRVITAISPMRGRGSRKRKVVEELKAPTSSSSGSSSSSDSSEES